ncbi:MAG TPA: hypothetical protein VJT75_08320 [Thermoleophilaceae bacterium]|nr:hypothetical protein [Thermoleophilaceae bacterium]
MAARANKRRLKRALLAAGATAVPMAAAGAADASVYWWYTPYGDANLIQTRTTPADGGAYYWSWVGQNHLDNHMLGDNSNPGNGGGIAGVIRTLQGGAQGDYCSAAKTGGLTTATSGAYGPYTGFTPPSPVSAYQRRSSTINGSACQADRARWGFYITDSMDPNTDCQLQENCGMGHSVLMGNTDNRPWSQAFGPGRKLHMKSTYQVNTFQDPAPYFGISFTCFVLQDMTKTTPSFAEICLDKWSEVSNTNTPVHDGAIVCASPPGPYGTFNVDTAWFTLPSYAATPVNYATQVGPQGSIGDGFSTLGQTRTVEFTVDYGQLKNIVYDMNRTASNPPEHCHRPLSMEPGDYRLVAVGDGFEAALSEVTRFGMNHSLIQAWTDY